MNKKYNVFNIIMYFIILILLLSIVFLLYFIRGQINHTSYAIFKAEYLTSKEKCDNLNLEDVKKLNEGFKEINYSGGVDYWCNLKNLNFSDLDNFYKGEKLKNIIIPSEIGKLKNLYEINFVKVNIDGVIPKEIGELDNLVLLELNGTGIKELPKEIEGLNKLRILHIDKYLYNSLPEIIKEKIKNKKIIDYSYYIEDYYK